MSGTGNSDASFLKDLRDEFVQSSLVDLDDWESDILDFESGESAKMDDLLRLIHSMKGSSQAIGLVELGACLHDLENWLAASLDNKPAPAIASVCLAFVDDLRTYCKGLTKEQDVSASIENLRKALK